MIEQEIADTFKRNGWVWNLKGGRTVVPNEEDVRAAMDEAAKQLHNLPVGSTLQVARLIFEKQTHGLDVYIYLGEYF